MLSRIVQGRAIYDDNNRVVASWHDNRNWKNLLKTSIWRQASWECRVHSLQSNKHSNKMFWMYSILACWHVYEYTWRIQNCRNVCWYDTWRHDLWLHEIPPKIPHQGKRARNVVGNIAGNISKHMCFKRPNQAPLKKKLNTPRNSIFSIACENFWELGRSYQI